MIQRCNDARKFVCVACHLLRALSSTYVVIQIGRKETHDVIYVSRHGLTLWVKSRIAGVRNKRTGVKRTGLRTIKRNPTY